MSVNVHPSAHVDKKAQLDDGVEIGPLCVVGPRVKLGKNVKLVSQVNIAGDTSIGEDCKLYPFVSLGHPPQDFKHQGGNVSLTIGARTVLRELVNIHPGTDNGRPETVVGDDCYFMVGSHLAHEGRCGNHVVFSNGVQVGGCVTIGDHVVLGGLCAIHQYTRIGSHAFVGGMATVTTDVIPYGSVVGNTAYLAGLNVIGLKRREFDRRSIRDLRSAYRLMFAAEGTFQERVEDAARLYSENELVMEIVKFIQTKDKRPICLPNLG
ncbi:MAG: acyl-[acyl-carrier-protein]--UDP-N-acetylglucosamine O-acyltransferase [Robiginitomaculum sp.]|nr:MAG: acyl-[acyl-carrier-protein]--UDP-N-acetylglucosamine O-acyltransferase [Robiginitomaculum sp.]